MEWSEVFDQAREIAIEMERKQQNLTQPPEWWAAFKEQAKRDGMKLSEWIGECCFANLDKDLADNLPDRIRIGRPRNKL